MFRKLYIGHTIFLVKILCASSRHGFPLRQYRSGKICSQDRRTAAMKARPQKKAAQKKAAGKAEK